MITSNSVRYHREAMESRESADGSVKSEPHHPATWAIGVGDQKFDGVYLRLVESNAGVIDSAAASFFVPGCTARVQYGQASP